MISDYIKLLKLRSDEELDDALDQLELRLDALNVLPLYPPPGYKYPHADVRAIEELINAVKNEIYTRHDSI